MKNITSFLAASLLLLSSSLAVAASQARVNTVFQYTNNGTWLESLAVRKDGTLLATRADNSELWSINPTRESAKLVYTFPYATSLSGITHLGNDAYAVVSHNVSIKTAEITPNSTIVWKVDYCAGSDKPKVTLLGRATEILFPNGVTLFDKHTGVILIADSVQGQIYRFNTNTGEYSVVLKDADTMSPLPGNGPTLGVNGVKYFEGYVYYTNSWRELFFRVKVDTKTAKATGPYEVLLKEQFGDDFDLDKNGVAYIATNLWNTIVRFDGKKTEVIAGSNSTFEVAGATACRFAAEKMLYCTTGGAQENPINGAIEPAKVVAVHLS